MRKVLLLIFLSPLFCFSQKSKGYAQINGSFNVSKPLGNGGGGSFGVQSFINNNISIGGGFSIIKYKNLKKIAPSAFADLRYHFGNGIKKPLLYFSLTPGYLFYSESYSVLINRRYDYYTYKGGFLIGAGLGAILYSGHNTAPFVSIMLNNFPLVFYGEKTSSVNYNVIKINFGMTF